VNHFTGKMLTNNDIKYKITFGSNIKISFFRGNVLEFTKIQKEDRGLYYCEVMNGVGKNVFREIDVVVEFPPLITSSKYIHKQPFRRIVNLDCRIEAYPTPSVVWMYNGLQLYNNHYTK